MTEQECRAEALSIAVQYMKLATDKGYGWDAKEFAVLVEEFYSWIIIGKRLQPRKETE